MKIWVKAGAADRRVPWPTTGRARRYFPNDTDAGAAAPVLVELDLYVQRRLAQGDLVRTDESGKPLQTATTAAPAIAPQPQPAAAPAAQPSAAAATLAAAVTASAARAASDAAAPKKEG